MKVRGLKPVRRSLRIGTPSVNYTQSERSDYTQGTVLPHLED